MYSKTNYYGQNYEGMLVKYVKAGINKNKSYLLVQSRMPALRVKRVDLVTPSTFTKQAPILQ